MIEFFDFLRVKPESLTVFFEENGSEKGWVVSLQVNESEYRKTEISSKIWLILKKCNLLVRRMVTGIPKGDVLFIY